jgi:hypothetical protein
LEGMNIQPKMIRVVNAVYNHSTFTILIWRVQAWYLWGKIVLFFCLL